MFENPVATYGRGGVFFLTRDEGIGSFGNNKRKSEMLVLIAVFTLLLFRSARSIELFNQFIKSLFPFVFVF